MDQKNRIDVSNYHPEKIYPLEETEDKKNREMRHIFPHGNDYIRYIQPELVLGKMLELPRYFDIFEGIRFSEWIPEKVVIKISGDFKFEVPVENKEIKFLLPIISLQFTNIRFSFLGKNCPSAFWCEIICGRQSDDIRRIFASYQIYNSVNIGDKNIKWIIENGLFKIV
jgi:hypothetical protein